MCSRSLILCLIMAVLSACGTKQVVEGTAKEAPPQKLALPRLDPQMQKELTAYLEANHQTPEDYVISKFKDHDIIFIGERHRLKQNVELIHRLIPRLHSAGIYNLGIEFARYADQEDIDHLINSEAYDPEMANELLFRNFPFWGYQEYADIFKAAWQLNKSLPEGETKFRIVGIMCRSDWSIIQTEEDQQNKEKRKRVWVDGDPDKYMGEIVLKEFVDKGKPALIYCGIFHGLTRYFQPTVDEKTGQFKSLFKGRAGNVVFDKIGARAMTINLHCEWESEKGYEAPGVYPADGYIDALMHSLGPGAFPVGFDVPGTPFGELPGRNSLFKYGYDNFTLKDFCDGYIYQCHLSQYQGVTPIPNYINEINVERAKAQCPNPSVKNPKITAKDLNESVAQDAEIPRLLQNYY